MRRDTTQTADSTARRRAKWRWCALVLFVSFASLGCQQRPPKTQKAAEKQAQNAQEPRGPYHVAPPPEYGNKVVLADAPGGASEL